MGLRCTVFGHTWGDVDTEREREEDGNEVVATVREVRTCGRCGAEDVLGTSKEITSLATESEPREEPATPDREPPDDGASYDPGTDDGVILDEDGDVRDEPGDRAWPNSPDQNQGGDGDGGPSPWPETARERDDEPTEERFVGADRPTEDRAEPESSRQSPAGGDDRPPSGSGDRIPPERGDGAPSTSDDSATREDGAEIIDAGDAEDTGRPTAENEPSPADDVDAPDVTRDDERRPTDVSTDDEAKDRAAADEDAIGGEEPVGGSADGGTMMGPDATERPDDDAEVIESTERNEQSRATAQDPVDPTDRTPGRDSEESSPPAEPSLDPSDTSSNEGPAPDDVEFYCSECDYVDESTWPSRRAGDICPNCRRSYLSERQR